MASQFQWKPDGGAKITVNGRPYDIQAGALSPGAVIWVGGQKVTVPQRPAAAPVVPPHLTADDQARLNDMQARWAELMNMADLGLKQAGIQLNEIDLPQINLRGMQQSEQTVEAMAGRGLSMSGIRDSALIDVERSRTMAETAARAAFQAAQDKYNATKQQVEGERVRAEEWKTSAMAQNAAIGNANIPPPVYENQGLKPAPSSAAPAPQKPGLPPIGGHNVAPSQVGRSIIVGKDETVYTPGGRPIGQYENAPRGYTISLTPGGRVKYTRSEVPKVKTK